MRKLLRFLLLKPITWAVAKFSAKPDREKIFAALSRLQKSILEEPGKKGLIIPFELTTGKFIIFSDQHKGGKDGADDFAGSEANYLAALQYYYNQQFHCISLGDSEELWENSLGKVKKHNTATFLLEKKFIPFNAFTKVYGNHDLFWDNDPLAGWQLKRIYEAEVKIYEGIILQTEFRAPASELPSPASRLSIFLTHGHQGDGQSDGNWFSKFFVARIWAPLQAYLKINPNTPAYDSERKTTHNRMMYEWASEQNDLLLVTGHTHQPVFGSLTHLERLYRNLQEAIHSGDSTKEAEVKNKIAKIERYFTSVSVDYSSLKPTYFNTGCCCFSDGDITGIEIDQGMMRLIKWEQTNTGSRRIILEEASLHQLAAQQ
jgi:hypothetical protein